MLIVGGVICGNCAIGRLGIATRPTVRMIAEMTAAKIGRRKKKPDTPAEVSSEQRGSVKSE
jgi:hypothetical protein